MRENGNRFNFSVISLPNLAVDENWVCWHCLLQFTFGKWCHLWCSDLFKLFVNGKLTERFRFFCAQIDFLFTILICSLDRSWAPSSSLCPLILGYAVHIFRITDTKCVMDGVCWRKSLKGSTTPVTCNSKQIWNYLGPVLGRSLDSTTFSSNIEWSLPW